MHIDREAAMKHLVLLLVVATTALVAGAASATAANEPVRIGFDKSISDPAAFVWTGTVSGDVSGTLTTRLTGLEVSGPIWRVRFDWMIAAGERSFVADLSGILNTDTGQVVMNGTVVEGWLSGAQVHEEGQLVDPATLRFVGEIQLMPASS
jgi:opacity protein-like surface antigen